MNDESGLRGWHRFIGRWETEGAHPMLPGEAIRGTSSFEWLDGQRFVICRSHHDHAQIPDAIMIIGAIGGQLSMHYYDSRGVHRVYAASLDQATWRFWRDAPAPDFSQRFTGIFSDDGNTITGRGRLSKDGKTRGPGIVRGANSRRGVAGSLRDLLPPRIREAASAIQSRIGWPHSLGPVFRNDP